jgi:hypothetical protein
VSTTYLSVAGLDQLAALQAELDAHIVSDLSGRCIACGDLEPCTRRGEISAAFLAYRRLPARQPGLAASHLLRGRRVA